VQPITASDDIPIAQVSSDGKKANDEEDQDHGEHETQPDSGLAHAQQEDCGPSRRQADQAGQPEAGQYPGNRLGNRRPGLSPQAINRNRCAPWRADKAD
jgi:hypothetical protein